MGVLGAGENAEAGLAPRTQTPSLATSSESGGPEVDSSGSEKDGTRDSVLDSENPEAENGVLRTSWMPNADERSTEDTSSLESGCENTEKGDRDNVSKVVLEVPNSRQLGRAIWVSMTIANLGAISFKWLVAVLLRKLFIWVEDKFSQSGGLLDVTASEFWDFIFLTKLDLFDTLGLSFAIAIPTAFCSILLLALPVRLASATARARRELLLDISLSEGGLLSESGVSASFVLEQIAVLFEYEANTQYLRAGEKQCVVVAIFFCFLVFWQGSMLSLFMFFIVLILQIAQGRVLRSHEEKKTTLMCQLHDSVLDVLRAADVVAMHNKEMKEKRILQAQETRASKVDSTISRIMIMMGFPNFYVLTVGMPCTLLLAYGIFERTEELAEAINTMFALLAMFLIFDEAHKSFNRLTLTNQQASTYAQSLQIVDGTLSNGQARLQTWTHALATPVREVVAGDLRFSNVTVRYPGVDEPAVQNVSFTIPQGLTMAVVAESGGGKSTLFRAASSLVQHEGWIYYGGVVLNATTKHAIRERLGFVSQDSMLFSRTLRDNIWYGNETPPDDSKIWTILEGVGLAKWVESRKQGLDTVLATERMVSGGQAQRLQIARLLCREGLEYVLLDECMSALDPAMRATVTLALRAFLQNKTVLVITHSHDTVADLCDEVLDLGKLQSGDSEPVVPTGEYLARLEFSPANGAGTEAD